MDVGSLIDCLIQMRENESSLIESISNLDLVLEGLLELDKMVEMEKVKKSIVIQIKFLLVNFVNMKDKKLDKHMIHTVLSGPPGVGKTYLGVILAKIWTGLGLIDSKNSNPSVKTLKNEEVEKLQREINNLKISGKIKNDVIKNLQEHVKNIKIDINNINLKNINYKLKGLKRQLKTYSDFFHKSCLSTIDDILNEIKKIEENINQISSNEISDERVHFITPIQHNSEIEKDLNDLIDLAQKIENENKQDSNLISIVSREDFVAGYVGQTALKTEKLLRENFGKILFIDEAYSLVNDEKDSFGMEALTVLNRYMSEYSDRIIIIFAGYKDMLEETIFKYQPGLKRRCSWYFEISNYSEKGLSKIFEKQLIGDGWKLNSEIDLTSFFKKNKSIFPNFGGSTLQLAFYCKLVYSAQFFDKERENTQIIDNNILTEALGYLKENNFHKEETYIHQMYC